MRPGIARAVPMGIIGFIIGALLAVVIRLLQGLDPNPVDPYGYVGPAMVLGAFISSGFFIWGIGAFDPRMNVHGEAPEETEAEAEASASPTGILAGQMWQVTFWLVVMVAAIALFAFLPFGPAVQSVQGDGNPADIGYTTLELPFGGPEVTVSYLTLFIVFVIWTILSLAVVAGVLAFLMGYFSRGVKAPGDTPIPWRKIIFVLALLAFVPLPLLFPNLVVPMAFLMPAIIIVPLLLVIGYPNAFTVILLLVSLGLPVFVPEVQLSQAAFVAAVIILGIVLLLPVSWLRRLVPGAIWRRYAAVEWTMLIPRFANAVARIIRQGLPRFLGQR
ncbi:MAG: hypothetical protein DWB42_11010 [Chloroflexi bacterium]|nr:hypothetical protein [Chloroflexota bacterium]MDL1884637.1 hypothetical protein [Anaerolineae bacterium CFX8]